MSISLYQMYQVRQQDEYQPIMLGANEVIASPQTPKDEQLAVDIVDVQDARSEAIRQFILRHNPTLLQEEPNFHEELVTIAPTKKASTPLTACHRHEWKWTLQSNSRKSQQLSRPRRA